MSEPLTQPGVSRHSSGIGNATLIAYKADIRQNPAQWSRTTGADGKCAKIVTAAAISPLSKRSAASNEIK